MSNREQGQQKPERPRVLKSHQVASLGYAFPTLEQVADRDLPPSLSSGVASPEIHGALSEADRRLAEAREAEQNSRALERRAAAFLAEAEETAAAKLKEAELRIEEMLGKTAAAIDEIEAETRERARRSGYEEGYKAAMDSARAEADALLQQARQEANAITAAARIQADQTRTTALREREEMLESGKGQLLDLAFVIARQVLRAETALRPELLLPMLEAALAKLKGEEEPQVRVSPEALALVEEHRGQLMAALPGARRLVVEADASLRPGDFVVQGAHGVVDGRLDQQSKTVQDAITSEER